MGYPKKRNPLDGPELVLSVKSPCPACSEMLPGKLDSLEKHYSAVHKRMPSEAEVHQFRVYRENDPSNVLSARSPCPACSKMLPGKLDSLEKHYSAIHKRMPSEAEVHRFRVYKKKDSRYMQNTDDYVKDRREVSGGLPSLGKGQ